MPVRASPRTGRLKPMLRVPPPPRAESPNGGTPSPGPSGSAKGKDKAKGKGPERRVLPARVRRAAGGGAEGIRDIEEMVVDWLERWGDVDPAPPESVVVRVSTAPLRGTYAVDDSSVPAGPSSLPMHVDAGTPSSAPGPAAASAPGTSPGPPAPVLTSALSTLAPGLAPLAPDGRAGGSLASSAINTPVPGVKRIETPAWITVKAGDDDAEEARQELVTGANRSPSKRLRHGVVGLEIEDTSDSFYEAQHRRFEAFEKRQRIREREQLQFNRYKMKARVDLLRNLPETQWVAMVAAILAREGDATWQRGRRKLTTMGNDWLRRHLIREGLEVLRRYDELLPKEGQHKEKDRDKERDKAAKGRVQSPASSSPPPQAAKPVIKLRLFSSAQREAAAREAREAAAKEREAEAERRRQRSRSSSLSSLSDCDPSSPASAATPTPTPTPSQPSEPSPASAPSAPSPIPLRLKLARPKGGSLQTTLKFEKPTPSPTKPPKAFRAPGSSTGSASTAATTDASGPHKVRRLSTDAEATSRKRSLRSQPSKNALGLVEDDEADMAGVEAEVLKL